jgi:flagellar hook-length control protein FliK
VEQAHLHLNPVEMGPVALKLSLDGQQVRVDMTAEHAATRQVLEQSMPALAGALRDAGFTLAGGGVFQPSDEASGRARNNPAGSEAGAGQPGQNGPLQQPAWRATVSPTAP